MPLFPDQISQLEQVLGVCLTCSQYHFHVLHVCVCDYKVSACLRMYDLQRCGNPWRWAGWKGGVGVGGRQSSASLHFYHSLVGKNVIKRTAGSEAPGL